MKAPARWAAVLLLLLGSGLLGAGAGAAQEQDGEGPPAAPKLDVDAALRALETESIYRAPGAVARFDEDLIRSELTDDMRVLVSPFTGRPDDGGHYPDRDDYLDQVHRPLNDWAEETGRTVIEVEGLLVSSTEGVTTSPGDLSRLRQHTGQYDVTDSVWSLIQHAKDGDNAKSSYESPHPLSESVEPSDRRIRELVDRLREQRVINAPGRRDRLDIPLELLEERTGFTVRAVAFPPGEPGEPLVDYAPALAEHFPDDIVLVAHGGWLEVAGGPQTELRLARDYAFGRFEIATLRQGLVMHDRIGSVLLRADTLLTEHPFGRPQPQTLRQLVAGLAPWLLGGSALVVGGVPLVRVVGGRLGEARDERRAFQVAQARAFAAIAELGERLVEAERGGNGPGVAAAAERHATARTLFDQAGTAAAMTEVRAVAEAGRRALRGRTGARGVRR
ncbi:hypothetical protein [Saccharomonospora piscinae]|uniref:hypothetical protein n=1 Tax=Saccharomonospora piscinae TaxID=687388 RepID=UPI000566FD28|nr:hypothetical protein [Saccharomonospora piscinae]